MRGPARPQHRTDVALRLRRVLASVDLDCRCRTKLDEALDRFAALECRQQRRNGLREARLHRDLIVAQLTFLADIDEITDRESDASVFEEMALLFDEIATQASEAAGALRATAATSAGEGSATPP
jgi:hypothetical protein